MASAATVNTKAQPYIQLVASSQLGGAGAPGGGGGAPFAFAGAFAFALAGSSVAVYTRTQPHVPKQNE